MSNLFKASLLLGLFLFLFSRLPTTSMKVLFSSLAFSLGFVSLAMSRKYRIRERPN